MMFPMKRRRGITLTETLLAIAVGASLLIAAVVWYIQSQGQGQYDSAQSELQGLSANIRSFYDPIGSYANITNTAAVDARLYPANMVINNQDTVNPRNPWGGDSFLSSANTGRAFVVTFSNVPGAYCARLASTGTNSGNLLGLSIASSTAGQSLAGPATGTSLMQNGQLIAPEQIAADCNKADAGSGVTMSWTLN